MISISTMGVVKDVTNYSGKLAQDAFQLADISIHKRIPK